LPLFLAIIVALIELVGGLAILFGLFVRYAALLGAITMLVALFMVHFPNGIAPWSNGGELALVYFATFLIFIAYGKRISPKNK